MSGFLDALVSASMCCLTAVQSLTSARMRVSTSRSAMILATLEPNAPFAPVIRTVLPLKDFVGFASLACFCRCRILQGKISDSIKGNAREMIITVKVTVAARICQEPRAILNDGDSACLELSALLFYYLQHSIRRQVALGNCGNLACVRNWLFTRVSTSFYPHHAAKFILL